MGPAVNPAAARAAGPAAAPARGPVVLAAGAVLWLPGRPKPSGRLGRPRIAVIHRPKYDDWSLPKGKLDPGEGVVEAALREVREETGFDCLLGPELPVQHYLAQGRPKEVRYWAAVPTVGAFRPNREVDRLDWLPAGKARARLTHDRDRLLIDALLVILGAKPVRTGGSGPVEERRK
ncbi:MULTISPECIES: NUDIX hydrolase [unclassified Kitasatospora]|uniref:NUDIX hydrolase n=1 Tax=unclassified Kitasatospora TaxID=2633591 RepID=UPI0035E1F361